MPKFKVSSSEKTKLSKVVEKINNDSDIEKTGFINSFNVSPLYKIITFRLRQPDVDNLEAIRKEVVKFCMRKNYSDSVIMRGLINYAATKLEKNIKEIAYHINNST